MPKQLLAAKSFGSHLECQNLSSYETTKSLTSLNQTTTSYMSFMTMDDLNSGGGSNCSPEYMQAIKQYREKYNVVKEMLSSEKKYIADIREIVEGYYDEIDKLYGDNQEFMYHIFSNIRDIFEFTKTFYTMLESASDKDDIAIAGCFIRRHKVFSRLYSTYCQNYKIAHSTTERLEKDHSIGKIIQKVRNKYGHSLKMATYLQLPVLRITKYHLLLHRYLKLQDINSPAYQHVLEALELMRQVNDQINDHMPSDNLDKPSTLTTLNLTSLFGSVLKQGNLIMTDTNSSHHVVVFQTIFLIRQDDCNSKVINTITNDCLGFSPITAQSSLKHWKRCFSVIDYNKSDTICQFTFRSASAEEKKAWQSAILSCMLNGYGKKISENIKRKVMRIDHDTTSTSEQSFSYTPKYESIKTKITNFKKFKDFKYSSKSDLRNNSCQNFQDLETSKISLYEDPNMTAPAPISNTSQYTLPRKGRISEPFRSPLLNNLLRKNTLANQNINSSSKKSLSDITTRSENALQNVLKKFKNSKLSRSKKKLDFNDSSFLSESIVLNTDQLLNSTVADFGSAARSDNNELREEYKATKNVEDKVELKLNDFEIIYQHFDKSLYDLDQTTNLLDETTVSKFEKFINKKIATSESNGENEDVGDEEESYGTPPPFLQKSLHQKDLILETEIYESSLSSKSSINSEEGYYSNRDSSASTLINEIQSHETTPGQTKLSKTQTTQRIPSITPSQLCKQRLTDSSCSDHFSRSSSTSGHLSKSSSSSSSSSRSSALASTKKNVIHIEIVNTNYDACQKLDASPFTNTITQQNLKNLNDCCQRPALTDSLRIIDNEVQLNGGNVQEAASFSSKNMQKFRYKKSHNHLVNARKLGHVTVDNYQRNKSATSGTSFISAISNIKLDQPAYRYEQFSRNLNASLSSIYDNAPETQEPFETESETDVTGLNSSVNLEKSFRSSVSSDRESSVSSYSTFKCQCVDSKNKSSVDTTGTDAKVNVKDLISKFENQRNESIVLC